MTYSIVHDGMIVSGRVHNQIGLVSTTSATQMDDSVGDQSNNTDAIVDEVSAPGGGDDAKLDTALLSPLQDYKSFGLDLLSDGTYIYHIQEGDTLCDISARLNCPIDILASYNGVPNMNLIYTGAVLRYPPSMLK